MFIILIFARQQVYWFCSIYLSTSFHFNAPYNRGVVFCSCNFPETRVAPGLHHRRQSNRQKKAVQLSAAGRPRA